MAGKKRSRDMENLERHMDIIQLPNSRKLFRAITLKNGLTALLVSNPAPPSGRIQYAAVCMAVRAGNNLDPLDAQGLAHFLEHMLFLGSDKFPRENSLAVFLNKGGGDTNAFTSADFTVFYLYADPRSLEKVLEMFSRFFIKPLINPESMKREINSIDEEFEKLKQDDDARLDQLRLYTSGDYHWSNRFRAGNKISLHFHNMDTLHKKTRAFFDAYYHGGAMKLSVIGQDSLFNLESWVMKYFADVKDSPKGFPKINPPNPIWNYNKLHVLKSVQGVTALNLTWMLFSYPQDSQEMPEVYLIEILRNQTKESLYGFFKEKGWLNNLEISFEGGLKDYKVGVRLFTLSLYITDSGLRKKYEMIGHVCEYITMLREMRPKEWVWNQYWRMKRMEFDCLDISKLSSSSISLYKYAKRLSVNMLKYPIKHVVSGDYVPKNNKWNSKVIQDFIKEFTPKNMRIDLVANSLDHNADIKTEYWCGSYFTEEDIPVKLTKQWSSISISDVGNFMTRFPKENTFIPTKGLNPRKHIISELSDNPPVCIVEKTMIKMWHKRGQNGVACAYFRFYLSDGDEEYNIKKELVRDIFAQLIMDCLSSIMFQGKQAGISNSFSVVEDQLVFQVRGHREKFITFLSKFWRDFKYLSPTMESFNSIKDKMIRDLSSIDIEEQSQDLMSSMLYEGSYCVEEKLENLADICFADMKSFISALYSQMFIEALCFGDMLKEEALEISEILEKTFEEPRTPQLRNQKSYDRVKLHVPQFTRRDVKAVKKSETNSLAKVYFQTGHPSLEACVEQSSARLNLFIRIVNKKLFDQLRTKEQLGYVVNCSKDLKNGVYGFYISVMSSKHNPDYILERIDSFLNDMKLVLENMPGKEFVSLADSVSMECEDHIESQWNEIVSKRYKFDIKWCEAGEALAADKDELIEWYKKFFTSKISYRKFFVGVWSMEHLKE